ncbi:hypothetical protein R1W35_000971 [Vibrio cholerae]|nr:hypothetical protein [Vibrio cholerae]EJO4031593.1 hypothetical protein [Vibrio cholerae]EKG1750428.1 hypothetical protein [Vibrio cholerae]ELP3385560.1 hypothetical protein [Vibrio cholerae]
MLRTLSAHYVARHYVEGQSSVPLRKHWRLHLQQNVGSLLNRSAKMNP